MHSSNKPTPASTFFPRRLIAMVALAVMVLAPIFLLASCMMTPEDKAFYGRGWINPDELDEESPPPQSFTDPTACSRI